MRWGDGGRYLGGRSGSLAWPSPEGTGKVVTTRRHEDAAKMIVADPSRSPRHMIGPADRVQSGQGIPGIPTPMPTGTMSSRKRRRTTTSTIATRRISPTVPRGGSSQGPTSGAAQRLVEQEREDGRKQEASSCEAPQVPPLLPIDPIGSGALHTRAVDIRLLAPGAPQRAVAIGAHMEMSDVMLVRNRPADRALPAVRQSSALRAQQALRCPHLTLLSLARSFPR
jgi:hypothetical protein